MRFPLTVLVRPSSRLIKSNSLSLYIHTRSYASCQTSKLSRLTASLSQIQPPAPLLHLLFLRFLCGSPTHCSVVHAPFPALIRSSRCLNPLRSLSLLHRPIFWLRIFRRPPPTPIIFFLFCFVSFSFFCVSFAGLLPPQRYYLPLSFVDYFEPSSVTLIGCTDPAISRHRSASCVADLLLHRLHQIAFAPIPGQPQQLHQSCRVHVSISRIFFLKNSVYLFCNLHTLGCTSQVSLNCNIVQEICNSTWQGKI